MKIFQRPGIASIFLLTGLGAAMLAPGQTVPTHILSGPSAFVSSTTVKAGLFRKITPADLPKPFATDSATTKSRIVPRPEGMLPHAPAGFKVGLFATGLKVPRVIRIAPNGDIFLVEKQAGQVPGFRGIGADGK